MEGHLAFVGEAKNDWERRYRASIADADRHAEAAKPRWVRRMEPIAYAARAWWVAWLVLTMVGFGLRAMGIYVPPAVGVPVSLLFVFGLYSLMRRETRKRSQS